MLKRLLFVLITSCTLVVKAQTVVSDTFITMFNTGNRVAVIDYLENNMSEERVERYGIDAHVGVLLNSQSTYGKLTLIERLPNKENNQQTVVVSENNGQTYLSTINLTETLPQKINYFSLQDPDNNENLSPKITLSELKQQLFKFIKKLNDKDAFSGSILVANGKDVLLKTSVGLANREWKQKNQVDTRFSIGSMNKMFTAISALQLIEKGELNFDDKLVQFVDKSWLPEGDVELITVRQLLTHTSGLGNFFNSDFNASNKEIYRDLDAYKPLVSGAPLLFSPGTRNRYSNSGMLMLGLIVEKVSGLSYYDYIQQNIYDQAGMSKSGSFELDSVTPNLAIGYLKRSHSEGWVNSTYTRAVKGSPAGGGFSTVSDLHKFALALTNYQLLGKTLTEQAYSAKTQYNSAFWYGYGFSVSGTLDDRVVGHGGAYLGVDARLDIHLDSGFIVVILANQSDVVAPVRREINQLLTKMKTKNISKD
jgi:CubicO group peptidase (beta-lactamase class C family)